jgi:hypothetical protein
MAQRHRQSALDMLDSYVDDRDPDDDPVTPGRRSFAGLAGGVARRVIDLSPALAEEPHEGDYDTRALIDAVDTLGLTVIGTFVERDGAVVPLNFDAVVVPGHRDTPEMARALVTLGAFPRDQWDELGDGMINATLV